MKKTNKDKFLSLDQKLILSALFLSIAAGRWGAWIGIPGSSIYLTDFLLVSGCLVNIRSTLQKKNNSLIYTFVLLTYVIVQLAFYANLPLVTRMRDLSPFIYLSLVPLIAASLAKMEMRSIFICLRYATLVNAIWSFGAGVGLIKPITIGGPFQVPIFSSRWDQTGIALAIGIIVWTGAPNVKLSKNTGVIAFLSLTVFTQGSRASILAFLIASTYLILRNNPLNKSRVKKILLTLLGAIIFLVSYTSILLLAPPNSALNRLTPQFTDLNQSNTTSARFEAQSLLLNYWVESGAEFFGVGAGDEMVLKSGAVKYLSGSTDVRSPHSWPTGLLVRFGLVGFILWWYLPLKLLVKKKNSHEMTKPIKIMLMAILSTSVFGVIIESPFGSVPFCILLATLLSGEKNESN